MSKSLATGWTHATLLDVSHLISGYAFKSSTFGKDGVPVIRISNLTGTTVRVDEDTPRLPLRYQETHERFLLRNGDVLLALSGATTGKMGTYCLHEPALLNQRVLCIRSEPLASDQKFLRYYIQDRRDSILKAAYGGAQPNVSPGDVGAMDLPLPPLKEQRRIVAKIESLFERSRRAKEALDAIPPLLDKLRQSILAAAFRGDLTADWRAQNPKVEPADKLLERIHTERRHRWEQTELAKLRAKGKEPKDDKWKAKYKDPESVPSGLPPIPAGWTWTSLDTLASIEHGYAFKSKDFQDDGPIVLTPGNFSQEGNLDFETKRVVRHNDNYDKKWILNKGDLVVVMTDLSQKKLILGSAVLMETSERVLHNQRIGLVHPSAKCVRRDFLRYAILSPVFKQYIDRTSTGTLIQHTSPTKILAGHVPIPPLEEQEILVQQVGRALSLLSEHRSAHRLASRDFQSLESSILAKAFRGELVEQDPDDEPASVLLDRIRAARAAAKPVKKKKARRRGKKNVEIARGE